MLAVVLVKQHEGDLVPERPRQQSIILPSHYHDEE